MAKNDQKSKSSNSKSVQNKPAEVAGKKERTYEINFDYHNILVKTTNEQEFKTKSCYGKDGDTIVLDVDPFNHPAWKDGKDTFVNTRNEQIAKFKKRFGSGL